MPACKSEDCDLIHCPNCGGHTYAVGVDCEGCQINRAADHMAHLTEQFDGNYEEACKFMGW
jgi:hypothetical protein